jgi:DNA-directed RNA polymerase II subunit RPB1
MNFHALQTIEARAEAENIMAVKHNIITPQSHRPIMSLVMDSFLGTSELSHCDSFLLKNELFDWMMETDTMEIPIPAIVHPKPLWTGKQALSMIMPKNLRYRSPKAMELEELDEVCIRDGQVLYGHFGKKILGRSQGSLVHILWLDFGPDVCINFLNKLQLGVHRWFSEQGFSIGVGDFIASSATQVKIEKEYQEAIVEASKLTKEVEINRCLNRARNGMGRAAADTMGRDNFLYRMVSSGVKGSMMNILQIMAMVGQQNSGGKRIARTIAGRTLPCFKADDTSPESLGMVRNPYMAGLTPSEFFFMGITGRDGLINTAINTAVTGYIQRRLVKAMETCRTEWDGSVRDANGAIITFQYGEDGFDGQSLEFNGTELVHMSDVKIESVYDWGHAEELKWVVEAKEIIKYTGLRNISSCFNVRRQIERLTDKSETPMCMPHEVFDIVTPYLTWFKERNILVWAIVLQSCAAKRLSTEFKLSLENISILMEFFKNKYDKTLIPAGEMVGTLAAQSLGEPVTQMTLDTFHHAGNSAKDVTLGVPRFEELINASGNPKTPTCSIIFNNAGPGEIDKAVDISYKIVHLIVRDVVTDPSVVHINFAQQHPTYYLMPDVPFKRLDGEGNWCVRLTVPHERMVKLQIEFSEVLKALRTKFAKGINMAYTFNPIGDSFIHLGNYGKKNNKISCGVLRNRVMNCYIRGVQDIKRAEPCLEEGMLTVETVGTNVYELYKLKLEYPCIKTVLSNHPFDVLSKFGIEAARSTLYQQCHMVLSRDGSYVSVRHYQVMVDRMTFSGAITAMTRHGIAKYENKSPLARATFEQPVEVLLNAASQRKKDPLSGVSEQILMGITPNIGTATISVHRTEEYKQVVKAAAEEESDDEEDGWLTFDNSTIANPFQKPVAPPMLHHPSSIQMWNQPQTPSVKTVPMWAQAQYSMPVHNTCQDWNQDVMAAVGGTMPSNNMFAPPQNMFAPPQNMFAPPQNMFQPRHRPTSPAYDPNRPTSPVYDPTSPVYNPNRPATPPYSPTSPEYTPPGSPTFPAYTPPHSPTSPEYTPPPSPTSPDYDEENQVYDPMAGYGAEN